MRYARLSITTFTNGDYLIWFHEECRNYRNTLTEKDLTMKEALNLMWLLVQAGGEKTVTTIPEKPTVCTREVILYTPLED